MGGDASTEGFASMTRYPGLIIEVRDRLWDPVFSRKGSNLQEAQCQANHLLLEIKDGEHDGCAVWCDTDNAVWSAV